jgi:hypothetical protein
MRGICAAVTGALLFGFGANAMADSTTDIVNALVAKGVLTEEEGALLNKGREGEAAGQAKAIKKAGRVTVSDAIDNATIYGNVRIREEYRSGTGNTATADYDVARTRSRGKFEFGVKTTAGNWYSDVAFVTGSDASARSDNFTFGAVSNTSIKPKSAGASTTATIGSTTTAGAVTLSGVAASEIAGYNPKESLYLKRAMLGWKPTNWLTLEGGRMANPLYTTQMMWDADYTVSGLNEKFNYKVNDQAELFATLGQWAHYKMDRTLNTGYSNSAADNAATTGEIYAFQAGGKYTFNDRTSGKAAVTHYVYGSDSGRGIFGASNQGFATALGSVTGEFGVNNLNIWEVPAEVNYQINDKVGIRLYGDYAINTDANERARRAGVTSDIDDTAWMLGLVVASTKDLKSLEGGKAKAGDWQANLWYQEIGLFAVDPSLGDSDIFDSRLNMKGVTFKGQYLVEDNVAVNLTAAHGNRLNSKYTTVSSTGADLSGMSLHDYDLVQLDLTYKF